MSYDRGSAILIEATFEQATPFVSTLVKFDPTTPTVTITDSAGTAKVSAAALTKAATGQFYYICQTATNWITGDYKVSVTGLDGTVVGLSVELPGFTLR